MCELRRGSCREDEARHPPAWHPRGTELSVVQSRAFRVVGARESEILPLGEGERRQWRVGVVGAIGAWRLSVSAVGVSRVCRNAQLPGRYPLHSTHGCRPAELLLPTNQGGVPREQKMLKGHLPESYITKYTSIGYTKKS